MDTSETEQLRALEPGHFNRHISRGENNERFLLNLAPLISQTEALVSEESVKCIVLPRGISNVILWKRTSSIK